MHQSPSRKALKNTCPAYCAQGLAEYSLVLALVAVACIGSLTLLGGAVGNGLNQISSSMSSALSVSANNATAPGGNIPAPPNGMPPPPMPNGALPPPPPGANGPIASNPIVVTPGGDSTTPVLGNTVTIPTNGGNTGGNTDEPIASLPGKPTVSVPGNITLPEDGGLISTPTKPTDIIGVPSAAGQ